MRRDLLAKLRPLSRDAPPFVDIPRAEARDAYWVEPVLVAEVEFTEWSRDGRLRHPSFQGPREDKPAREVRAERPGRGPLWFQKMDRNRDGDVSRKEWLWSVELFRKIDTDGDGLISLAEAEAYDRLRRRQE